MSVYRLATTSISPKNRPEGGFSLVELSISLIVIGALVGMILKGQDLVQNARVSQTAQHLKMYDAGFASFYDSYGALPGDITNPAQYIPNCTAANGCLPAGNGDGKISGAAPEYTSWFKHLTMLDLVPATQTGSYMNWIAPSSVVYARYDDTYHTHYLNKSGFNVKVLEAIDKRIDDGKPNSGRVRTQTAACIVSGKNDYNVIGGSTACALDYLLQY